MHQDGSDHISITTSLPCHEQRVLLRVPAEAAIHLHERTCKTCGESWTFATECEPHGSGWSIATFAKLGRPTIPAVTEVLTSREDGWIHDDTIERHRFRQQLRASHR
jgi:hypothetical protein